MKKDVLNGKNIILICPKFFGYEVAIKDAMIRLGACTHIIYENLEWLKFSYKIVYAYLPGLKPQIIRNYYLKMLDGIIDRADYIVVIRGESLSCDILDIIKTRTKQDCKYILYQWDGVNNNPNALKIARYFERVLTFDITDAANYGWIYRPLFFVTNYIVNKRDKKWDLLYICSLHSNRVKILNQLKCIAAKRGYNIKSFLYQKMYLYLKYKYFDKKEEVAGANIHDITFKPITAKDSYSLYSEAVAVVDYTHPNQTGYTMRTIECLGNNCKLITNNAKIREADFYNENNIHVYENDFIDIPEGFLESPYEILKDDIYTLYSIEKWAEDLLGI